MGGMVNAAFSYWNGVAWAPLSTTRNEFGHADGDASFSPPSDWAASSPTAWPAGPSDASLAPTPAYWLKVTVATGAPTSILVGRVSAIKNLTSPAGPSRFDPSYEPLSWSNLGTSTNGVDFTKYDVSAPGEPHLTARPNPFSPNGDGIWDKTFISANYAEQIRSSASVLAPQGNTPLSTSTLASPSYSFEWDGKVGGTALPPGAYKISVTSVDDAGNARTDSTWSTIGPGPTITSITPTTLQIGQKFTIQGSGFGNSDDYHSVTFSGRGAMIESWSSTQIVGYVPPDLDPGSYGVSVWAMDVTSLSRQLTISNRVVPGAGEAVVPGRISLKLKDGADINQVLDSTDTVVTPVRLFPGTTDTTLNKWWDVHVPSGHEVERINAYASDQRVDWAEYQAPLVPAGHHADDPLFDSQWALNKIEAQPAWDMAEGPTSTVRVALIDSGVGPHEDLAGKIVGGRDFTGSGTLDDGCVGTTGYGAHGTQVAGVIAARANNQLGIAGIAYNNNVVVSPYKVFGAVTETSTGVKECRSLSNEPISTVIYDAADDNNAVINISGTLAETPRLAEQAAITSATRGGKIVVAAAGNDGLSVPEYPASYSDVVSVGAMKRDGTREEFSNWGPWVDISAPGDNVITTDIVPSGSSTQQTYNYDGGTSIAAAIVSGAAAFMKGLPNNPSSSDIMNAIAATAQGDVTTNHPLYLDVRLAVRQLLAHAWNTQLDLTPGRFVAIKSGGGLTTYLVDNGSIRPVVSSQALESWGERPESLYSVVAAPYDLGQSVGFRPGSLISPKITGGLDAPGDEILVVTNDPQPVEPLLNGRWTRGQATDVTASLGCLGFKIESVVAVDPSVAAVHGTPSVWQTCNLHPNGTILRRTPTPPPDIEGNSRYDHRAWMLD
ncbi:MAG: S8 family serine peptidase, partial [Actinobacteria bacterium]|nr:S8 family serine peptidase [Actinomycetota bacterium]